MVKLGKVGATQITATITSDTFESWPGRPAETQITLTANYSRSPARAGVGGVDTAIGAPGFPMILETSGIDTVASQNGAVVPSGSTVWAWTCEANALIASAAATATGRVR